MTSPYVPPGYHHFAAPVPTPAERRKSAAPVVIGVLSAAVAFLACAIGVSAGSTPDATAHATLTSITPKSSAKAVPKSVTIKGGTWEVGSEVRPGTYVTTATDTVLGCYWARLSDFEGDFNSIIANGTVDEGERGRITIKSSDKGIELSGECVWTRK